MDEVKTDSTQKDIDQRYIEQPPAEKTITRYFLKDPLKRIEGIFVAETDHEAALTAQREQFEARIAELERDRQIADDLADHWEKQAAKAVEAVTALRSALEAIAGERIFALIGSWVEPGEESPDKLRALFLQDLRNLSAELSALIEVKK